jgi:hypothetical protein
MLAIRTGYEAIEVGEDEMKAWLRSAQRVARHYSVKTTQTAIDWIAFTGMSAQVFGTRAVAVALEAGVWKRPEGEGARRRGNVRPFPRPVATAPDVPPPPGPEMGVEPEGGF